MFWVGSVAGRGQIDISRVLPFSMGVKVYLLLSRRGVTLRVFCCSRGCLSRGWCMFGSLVVSFYYMRAYYPVSGVWQFPLCYVCGEACAIYGLSFSTEIF